MKIKNTAAAYSLIEMLVYISIVAVLLGLGYAALYRCMDNSAALRRSADDIAGAIHAGEQWRNDVRAAGDGVRLETNSTGQIFLVPNLEKEVAYKFTGNTVFRRAGDGGWSPVLSNVKATSFIPDSRSTIPAWRWELELQPRRKRLDRIQPLFTFIAVPVRELQK
jgi:type II secretory pathway pseudopilin PulG